MLTPRDSPTRNSEPVDIVYYLVYLEVYEPPPLNAAAISDPNDQLAHGERSQAMSVLSPDGRGPTAAQPLFEKAKQALLVLVEAAEPGDSLPTYPELAARLRCSLAPIKQAMHELQHEGRVSLQRGRPAKVVWNNSFTRSARQRGGRLETRPFQMAYRQLEADEHAMAGDLGLAPGQPCLVCGRVRIVDGTPLALQLAYINPNFFREPTRFFLEHDVIAGSLSEVYADLGFRPLRVTARLTVGRADARERGLLSLPEGAPVLRSHQQTAVDREGRAEVLEILQATYTQDIEYIVERLPDWRSLGGTDYA